LRRTASNDVLSVEIRPTVSPVGERKDQEKKLNIRTFGNVYPVGQSLFSDAAIIAWSRRWPITASLSCLKTTHSSIVLVVGC